MIDDIIGATCVIAKICIFIHLISVNLQYDSVKDYHTVL